MAIANVYWLYWSVSRHAKLEKKYGMKLEL